MTENLLWEYQKLVKEIYYEQNLSCLSGLNNEYLLNGRPILVWHNEVTRKFAVKNSGHFNYLKNLDDILFCSDELLYFTALLFLYRPFINNPLKEAYYLSDTKVYPNIQNLHGKRYGMFADVASQTAYNFWDRIGDMIASFFPEKIKPERVFFTTTLDIIPSEFRNSPNFLWLQNFRETDFNELNEKRKQVVHYTTSEIEYQYKHLEKGVSDREEMEKIQLERKGIADFYKRHIELTFIGFEKSLLLLEEISKELFIA
jgi:hypothetical protein